MRRSLCAALVLGALTLTACGSDDTPEESANAGQDAGETPDDSAEQNEDAESDSGSDAESDSGSGGASADEFCTQMEEVSEHLVPTFDATDLSGVADSFQQVLDALEPIEVPDELSSAWADLTGFYEAFVDAFEGVDTTDQEALADAMAGIDIEAASAAGQGASVEIASYVQDNCGVVLESQP